MIFYKHFKYKYAIDIDQMKTSVNNNHAIDIDQIKISVKKITF